MKKPFSINNIEYKDDLIILESYTYERETFYVDRDKFSIHTSLPMTEENIVQDGEVKSHIISCLNKYRESKEDEVFKVTNLIKKLTW